MIDNNKVKTCCSCKQEKSAEDFGSKRRAKDGRQSQCKICSRATAKSWPSNSRDSRRKVENRYKLKYPGRRAEILRRCRKKNLERQRKWAKDSYLKSRNRIEYRLRHSLRNRLIRALKSGQRSGSAVQDLGCTISELRAHLEGKFSLGMSWDVLG